MPRTALSTDESMAGCVHGDLRTLPLPQRSHDIVLCALLLQRIQNAELVLDRLVATIRPGGLLLLRFSDRDSAAGFLDRALPAAARRAVWRRRRPGQPGPYEAVYERLSSARGIQAYALMRELVIAERRALGGLAGGMAEPYGFLAGHFGAIHFVEFFQRSLGLFRAAELGVRAPEKKVRLLQFGFLVQSGLQLENSCLKLAALKQRVAQCKSRCGGIRRQLDSFAQPFDGL